jgi:hypothetical protein
MANTPPPPQVQQAPQSLCDLVMKGGITSGVIYPRLIHELSQRYRFKNIGGTSAGAIAAGACAAAEYGRQHGNAQAFATLDKLPGELGETVQPGGRSRLLSLFQPHPALQLHFSVLLQALNKKPVPAIVGMLLRMLTGSAGLLAVLLLGAAVLLAPLVQSLTPRPGLAAAVLLALGALVLTGLAVWRNAAAASVPGLALTWAATGVLVLLALKLATGAAWGGALVLAGLSLLLGCVLAWVLLMAAALARFTRGLLKGLHRNRYGLCSGQTNEEGQRHQLPGLTDWLAGYFDGLAGLTQRAHPLTFGDLWGTHDRQAPRNINLEVMTSAVSQQMVYSIPFRDGSPGLYYDPDELKDYFPPRVMAWLAATAARPDDDEDALGVVTGPEGQTRALLRFPRGADLPVVVAIRMSLSFPLLLSAVPLYSVDHSLAGNRDAKAQKKPLNATRVWFSDGGIGSNMPLHMFDALLPGHPTFAVNLKPMHPDHGIKTPEVKDNEGGRIYLPGVQNGQFRGGNVRHWAPPADGTPLGGLAGFLVSIVNTMQNWRDEIQFPYPGFKDRIVQISQRDTEGGLNLDMPASSIEALGNAGAMAAHRLIDRFHPAGAEAGAGWTYHQAVRLATFLGTMQPGSAALYETIQSGHWGRVAQGIKYSNNAQKTLAQDFLNGLGQLGAAASASGQAVSLADDAPRPLALVRVSPRI